MKNDFGNPQKKKKFNTSKTNETQPSLKNQEFDKIQEFKVNLPIYSAKDKLKQEIRSNTSLVIIGETGKW